MMKKQIMPVLFVAGGIVAVWLLGRYALPVGLPFLSGAVIALGAEPLVGLMHRRLKFPRWLASTVGVLVTMVLLLTVGFLFVLDFPLPKPGLKHILILMGIVVITNQIVFLITQFRTSAPPKEIQWIAGSVFGGHL